MYVFNDIYIFLLLNVKMIFVHDNERKKNKCTGVGSASLKKLKGRDHVVNHIVELQGILCNPDFQVVIAQQCIISFAERGIDTYDSFQKNWKNNNTSQIHSHVSPRKNTYGPFQAASSAFLGYVTPDLPLIYQKGGIFGIYMLYRTQPWQYKFPIITNNQSLEYIFQVCNSENELLPFIRFLINQKAILVSNKCILIKPVSKYIPSIIAVQDTSNPEGITRSTITVPSNDEFEELEAEYKNLLTQINL